MALELLEKLVQLPKNLFGAHNRWQATFLQDLLLHQPLCARSGTQQLVVSLHSLGGVVVWKLELAQEVLQETHFLTSCCSGVFLQGAPKPQESRLALCLAASCLAASPQLLPM